MSDKLNGSELLQVAREELVKRLLPELPAALRYQALMVANAMMIACRELELEQDRVALELAGLRDVLGVRDSAGATDAESRAEQLQALRRRLCAAIRAGEFDQPGAAQAALLAHLQATASGRVAITRPRLLHGGRE
jgi:hypothetical protein